MVGQEWTQLIATSTNNYDDTYTHTVREPFAESLAVGLLWV